MTKQNKKENTEKEQIPSLNSSMQAALDRIGQSISKRNRDAFPERKTNVQRSEGRNGKIVQLPLWPNSRRGIPNDLVRGALFTVGNCRTARAFKKNAVIATLGGIDVAYTGEELRQDDEDVFLQLVHLARTTPLGNQVTFTAHSLLKSLEWSTNKPSYERLKATITRLSATGLEVRTERAGYSGSLIRDFEWREEDGRSSRAWKVRLEPRIISLFGHVSYSQITWDQRLQLGNLSKWLHSFYYSHAKPYPMKVETLHLLCGSTTKSRAKFRQLLKKSLDELVSVEFLESWELSTKDDKVFVTRSE